MEHKVVAVRGPTRRERRRGRGPGLARRGGDIGVQRLEPRRQRQRDRDMGAILRIDQFRRLLDDIALFQRDDAAVRRLKP